MKLDKIISAFRGYRDARAPIYELAESLAGIRPETAPQFRTVR
jgi:hypothetical protein